eukprot:42409-Amphidinium_carterae.1
MERKEAPELRLLGPPRFKKVKLEDHWHAGLRHDKLCVVLTCREDGVLVFNSSRRTREKRSTWLRLGSGNMC